MLGAHEKSPLPSSLDSLLGTIFSNWHTLVTPVQTLELALAQSSTMQQISRQQPQNG